MKSFREKLLRYGSCFIIFILPLLYFGNMFSAYSSSKTFLFYGFVEILALFWVYSVIVDRAYHFTKKQFLFFIPFILYLVWLTISGILAANPTLAFWSSVSRGTGLLTLYHAFVLSLIVSSVLKKEGEVYLYKLLNWFLSSGFILALSVWFGNEGFNLFLKDSQGGGLIGNSSMTAAYMLFVIALGLFLIVSKNIKKSKKWWIGIILTTVILSPLFVNIYGFLNGHSILGSARGATFGIFVIIGVTFLCYFFFSKKKIFKILGIIGIFLSIIAFSIGWSNLMTPGSYLHDKFVQATSENRFTFWNSAQKGMDKHPYFGYGVDNYSVAFQDHFDAKVLDGKNGFEGWPDHSHNVYFDTGIYGGYPAIVLYSIFLLSIIYGIYIAFKKERINQLQASVLCGLIIGYVFQNLFIFDSLLSINILFVLAGIIFALDDHYIKEKYPKVLISESIKNTIAFFLSVLYIPLFIFFVYMPIDKAIAYNKLINMTIDERLSHYNDLLEGSSVGGSIDVSSMADTIYKYYATNLPQIKKDKNLSPYVDADLTAFTKYLDQVIAKDKSKNDFRLYISDVFLYNTEIILVEKSYEQNLADYLYSLLDHAEKLSPANPETYWARANISAWKGDLKGSEDAYKEAISMDPGAPGSYRLLINFAKVTNNQKLYTETIIEAQKNIPDFKME